MTRKLEESLDHFLKVCFENGDKVLEAKHFLILNKEELQLTHVKHEVEERIKKSLKDAHHLYCDNFGNVLDLETLWLALHLYNEGYVEDFNKLLS